MACTAPVTPPSTPGSEPANTPAPIDTVAPTGVAARPTVAAVATSTTGPTSTAAAATSGPLIEAALGNLTKTLHPYPDSASYTQPWVDVASLIWGGADGGGGLLAFDWDTLDCK